MEKKKCVIITGGDLSSDESITDRVKNADFIIAVDGGARYAAKLGTVPHLAIGDFDTLTPQEVEELERKGVAIERHPPNKDYTDTHLAVLKALEMGYRDIILVAALGNRFDHTLANVMLLLLPEAKGARIRIIDSIQEISLIRGKEKLNGKKGDIISLLPLSEKVRGISTSGLNYQVPKGQFIMGISNGVSNVFCEDEAEIVVEEGLLLAIRVKKP